MADSDAIIVTFTAPDGQAYNVWCWPHPDGFGSHPSAAVNVRRDERWIPLAMVDDCGNLPTVEVQGGLF